jgi:hypothetical protein
MKGDCPRYVWTCLEDRWFEGFCTNHEKVRYKGWPVEFEAIPEFVRSEFVK